MSEQDGVDVGDISHLEAKPPPGTEIAASIHIILTTDGRVLARSNVVNRLELNLLMSTAWQDLVSRAQEAEKQMQGGGLVLASPNMRFPAPPGR